MGGIMVNDIHGNPIFDPNKNAKQMLNLFFPDDSMHSDLAPHQETRAAILEILNNSVGEDLIPDITKDEVKIAFNSSQPFAATPDQCPVAFFNWNLDMLAAPLAKLYSACLKFEYFPISWKSGSLLTIPKQSAEADLSSHKSQRPITLLPILGKAFERILLERFLHLKPEGWCNRAQRGFIKGSSTEATLLALRNQIDKKLKNSNLGVAGLSLDISAAFDMAWHPAILKNLHDKGLPIQYLRLIQSYLSDRQISLSYGGGSATKTLTRSTPQGSVLSPFLWNIFLDTLLVKLEKLSST